MDKRLKLLIALSSEIMKVHKELVDYLKNGGNAKDLFYEKLTNKLRLMIASEQEFLSRLDKETLDKYLEAINKHYSENLGGSRLKDRIIYYKSYDSEYSIEAKSLGFDNTELKDRNFIIDDTINAISMLKAFKLLGHRLNNYSKDGEINKRITELDMALDDELAIGKLALLCISPFYEMMFLNFGDDIPEFNLNKIGSAFKAGYRKETIYNNCINDILNEAIKKLMPFTDTKKWSLSVKYNSEDIFDFFLVIAELEGLIPYMSDAILHELEILFNRPVTIGRLEFEPITIRATINKALKK